MKILLINPPAREIHYEPIVLPPLGLLYLAALLMKNSHQVEVLDCFALNLTWEEYRNRLSPFDVIGITGLTPTIDSTFRALRHARDFSRHLVLGGPHATASIDTIFRDCPEVDYVIQREAEYSFLELVTEIEAGQGNEDRVPGVATRTTVNPPGDYITSLDQLPFPARQLVPWTDYRYPLFGSGAVTSVITSRGCPYSCIFCDKSICGSRWRARSVANVMEELFQIKHDFGITNIIFYDDLFTLNRKRVLDLCCNIIQAKLDIRWKCEGTVDSVDEEMLEVMKKSGCQVIAYGVESAHQKSLDYLNKPSKVSQAGPAFAMTRRAGIKTMGYFLLGLPPESYSESEQTIELALQLKADFAQFSILSPTPGTALYKQAQKKGWYREIKAHNLFDKDLQRPVVISENWSEENLEKIIKQAQRRFYFRPSFLIKSITEVSSLGEFTEKFKLFQRFMKYLFR
ncbi:B12-binding domain-containing radical SAM protein [candidate division CSSED10-310 bacterium]|uniref:B12-binding domain-containing radical SAM protein n=1 Tax=candidate division CSSED10-310 bacterium TaxID=2855610 RepID=A0ABV6YWB5_UNCC1